MNSKEYWRDREEKHLAQNIKTEAEYAKEIEKIYNNSMAEIQKEIDAFYTKYAGKEGITIAEAKKRASTLDIEAYERKAKKYVSEKNFSKQANEEMRLYNLTMKVNRLELLKSQIGLELVSGFDEMQKFFDEKLTERTLEEFKRQAGILGDIGNAAASADVIVNASFHNATFSQRIWGNQSLLKSEIDKLLQTGLMQGRNPKVLARDLRERFGVSRGVSERLMRTEMARVQVEAQKKSYEASEFDEYEYVACHKGDACKDCSALDGEHFKVKDMMPGENAPPMHPNCHCSTCAYVDEKEYNEWLDSYKDHEMSFKEWQEASELSKHNAQLYRKVSRGERSTMEIQQGQRISVKKVTSYSSDVYVSDRVKIKPRVLHCINKNTETALSAWGIPLDRKPKIVIVSPDEMPTAYGKYDAINNIVYYIPQIADKEIVGNVGEIEFHEMWHMKQAENFRGKYGEITYENYLEYIEYSCNQAKKTIDETGINEYNVIEISTYARDKYMEGRFDEVEAEYMVLRKRE